VNFTEIDKSKYGNGIKVKYLRRNRIILSIFSLQIKIIILSLCLLINDLNRIFVLQLFYSSEAK